MVNEKKIIRILKDLNGAKNKLKQVQNNFKDKPQLLSLYESNIKYLISKIKEQLDDELGIIKDETITDTDLWIKLNGPSINEGVAPIGVLSSFLSKFALANKNILSLLENIEHTGGRFLNKIEELSEFNLVSLQKGSIKLGFKKSDPGNFVETQLDLFDQQTIRDILEYSKKSVRAVSFLLSTIDAANNNKTLDFLQEKFTDKKDILKILYHAKELTPSSASKIDSIIYYGKRDFISKEYIQADHNTREKFIQLTNDLIAQEEFVIAKGTIREMDLDKAKVILRSATINDINIDEVNCNLNLKINDIDMKNLLDKPVEIGGHIVFSDKGEIQRLEIEQILSGR